MPPTARRNGSSSDSVDTVSSALPLKPTKVPFLVYRSCDAPKDAESRENGLPRTSNWASSMLSESVDRMDYAMSVPGAGFVEGEPEGSGILRFKLGLVEDGVALIWRQRPWRSPLGRLCLLHVRARAKELCTRGRIAAVSYQRNMSVLQLTTNREFESPTFGCQGIDT